MPGPAPKNPLLRQRRNRKPTVANLEGAPAASSRQLPVRDDKLPWHRQASDLWTLAWASPMAAEYLEADVAGLLLLVELTHRFWNRPDPKTAAEIRQQRLVYGLDPMARRRLQWEVARAKEATRKTEPTPTPKRANDPRLRLVSSGTSA